MMEFFFGKSPEQLMRECKRTIDRSCRDLQHQTTLQDNRVKQLENEIKAAAKRNEIAIVRAKAAELVRTRAMRNKTESMRAQLLATGFEVQRMKSSADMSKALVKVTKAMQGFTSATDLKTMQKTLMEFEKQSEKMNIKNEMISDTMDSMFDDENTGEETDKIVDQVLSDLGIEIGSQLSGPPASSFETAGPTRRPEAVGEDTGDSDLLARLDRLKKT